jgi:hypothetical protein
MLCGRLQPELGGRPEYLDILGLNFYPRNQWIHNTGYSLLPGHPRHRLFRNIIEDVWNRYNRPLFVSETGTEDDYRAVWMNYVCSEVMHSMQAGIPVHGICWYPILNHPGWDDDRHCCNGMFDYAAPDGSREIFQPLAQALAVQQQRFAKAFSYEPTKRRPDLSIPSALGIRFPTPSTPDESLRS